MNAALKALLFHLINKRYIGGKHTPENQLIKSKTKWLTSQDKKSFEKAYKTIVNEGFILRIKKKTGKGSDWHICLNPRKLKELNEIIKMHQKHF
ncbi:hypothetical protein ACFL0W_06220 [Nanoarchaeota archaeon]